MGRKWRTFLDKQPYSPNAHVDDNGHGSLWFEQHRPVPPVISILLGEFFYNLRAALDYCAFASAIIDSEQDPPPGEEDIQFPIYSRPEGFAGNHYRIHPLSDKHRGWLEAIQPYAGGNDPHNAALYWINELARRDRHRQLQVVGAYVTRSAPMVRSSRTMDIVFEDVDPYVFVEGDTEIARFKIVPYVPGDHIEANPNSTLNIEVLEFTRQRPVDAEWLFYPLNQRLFVLEAFVDGIVGTFERDCMGSTLSKFAKNLPGLDGPAK